MKTTEPLPLLPLLHAYTARGLPTLAELGRLPDLGPRFTAVLSASAKFLYPTFVNGAADLDFANALARFHDAVVQPSLHGATLRRRAGVVRHGLGHLLRGRDALPLKAEACLAANGAYHVPGLGPRFWSALFQGLRPAQHPGWTPSIRAGLARLGLARWRPGDGPGAVYAALLAAYQHLRGVEPALTALHLDHFLSLVAHMRGRNLSGRVDNPEERLAETVLALRSRRPLRELLKERGPALAAAQQNLEEGLRVGDGKRLGTALAVADPDGAAPAPIDWGADVESLMLWIGRFWEADDPYPLLESFWQADPIAGAGLWLPAAVLHLRDPQRYFPWNDAIRRGYATLDDSADLPAPPVESYHLFNDGVALLRERHNFHPLELPAILASLAEREDDSPCIPLATDHLPLVTHFGGFCVDTFRFLNELGCDNRREWMEGQRERYRFVVRQPLIELCRALTERYVRPVLHGVHGWDLDCTARPGHALTSVCRNSFGRGGPYNTTLWIVFGKRDGPQLFVRLDAEGLHYGLRLGRKARTAIRAVREAVRVHIGALFRTLSDSGALASCRFGQAEASESLREIGGPDDLFAWVEGRSLEASRSLPAGDPLLESDDLAGEVLLTFDRLLPLFACAVEAKPETFLRRGGGADDFNDADFRRATFLGDDWLRKARGLLSLKRQLILQGVPGTGKTHVARCLARLLARGCDDAVRLVQFHPAYSYEEFVEGIKVRSVEVQGRHDVTYPVEDGLLCAFAAEAARRPAVPHVLIVDEINRGNLPRIFGELLYLLEYRGQAVELPCSRRAFRLPDNLYLLGTMNAADRSVALVDQALRRRFSFLEMEPDAAVLSAWLTENEPAAGPAFAMKVLRLFECLNARLRDDLGSQGQVGHSYFMVPGLDEAKLRMVWQHHVRPLLAEHFAGQPGRLAGYDPDTLLDGEDRRPRGANGRRRRTR